MPQAPILDVHLIGGFANRMIQYMVVRRLAAEVPGCRISNVALPEWNIDHPVLPGRADPELRLPISCNDFDYAAMVNLLSSPAGTNVSFKSYAQWFPYFPKLDSCRSLFLTPEHDFPGYGPEYLVCNIRGGEILDARNPHYVLLPIEFYAEIAKATGLALVFMGQIEDNAYLRALRLRFPDATFHPTRGVIADFQTFRNSKNLVPAISTFSWLAAWLSNADFIALAVDGLFHPVQCPHINLLPLEDERYSFYLFPINYSVPVEHFQHTHGAIQDSWCRVDSDSLSKLRGSAHPKRLDKFIAMFDEKFYLQENADVSREVAEGRLPSGRDHYVRHGFREGRHGFAFDERSYSVEYPLAAREVGQGYYSDLQQHYVEVGAGRGYKPLP